METIKEYYEHYWKTPSDINEHFPIIKKYAEECKTIYELGVRSIVSTWALLAGKPTKMVSVDIYPPSFYGGRLEQVINACKKEGINFKFELKSSLEIELKTDLLFIDTLHTYEQLKQELSLHSFCTKKYILLHDTESCKDFFIDSQGVQAGGLEKAINEFLAENKEWRIKEIYTNNNGLTIMERV